MRVVNFHQVLVPTPQNALCHTYRSSPFPDCDPKDKYKASQLKHFYNVSARKPLDAHHEIPNANHARRGIDSNRNIFRQWSCPRRTNHTLAERCHFFGGNGSMNKKQTMRWSQAVTRPSIRWKAKDAMHA